jgi:hypothetical protein
MLGTENALRDGEKKAFVQTTAILGLRRWNVKELVPQASGRQIRSSRQRRGDPLCHVGGPRRRLCDLESIHRAANTAQRSSHLHAEYFGAIPHGLAGGHSEHFFTPSPSIARPSTLGAPLSALT